MCYAFIMPLVAFFVIYLLPFVTRSKLPETFIYESNAHAKATYTLFILHFVFIFTGHLESNRWLTI